MSYEEIAQVCLKQENPLDFIENVMFEMSSLLPDSVCEKTWNEIAEVFINNRK